MFGKQKDGGQVLLIPQEAILPNKHQARKHFDADALEALAESIRQNGILQPITVRPIGNAQYELIAGERRLRAARIVGIQRIPCIEMDITEEKSAVFAIIENLQRQDLDFLEEAEAMVHLMLEFHLTQDELANQIGKASAVVSNKLRLLHLPCEIRNKIQKCRLTEHHARALLKLPSEQKMRRAVDMIAEKKLSIAQTDKLIEQMLEAQKAPRKMPIKLFKDVRIFVNTINHAIDTMQRSGIPANAVKSETDEYIEFVVRIPKSGKTTDRLQKTGT